MCEVLTAIAAEIESDVNLIVDPVRERRLVDSKGNVIIDTYVIALRRAHSELVIYLAKTELGFVLTGRDVIREIVMDTQVADNPFLYRAVRPSKIPRQAR